MTTINEIELSHDSYNRIYRRRPRAHQTLPIGTLVEHVTDGGRTVYRVVECGDGSCDGVIG